MRMTLPAGLLLFVVLAGCDRQSPKARAAPAVVASPLDGIPDGPAPPMTIKPSFQCPKPAVEGEPILPLDTPLTELQKLICDEPELALLDGHVHQAYLAARLRSGVDRSGLSKAERQWKADLDSCLKAADPRDCVAEASRTRLVELALQDPATVARTQLEFTCKGTATPLTAAFYGGLDPAFAVLGFGREQAIVFVQPTHAGLKYGRTGVDFFVRQGQVKAEFYGRTLACVSPTWRPAEMPPTVPDTEAMAALVEQVAPLPPLPTPASTPASPAAPAAVAQATDAPVRQVAPQTPASPTPAPSPVSAAAPVSIAASQAPARQARQVTSRTPTASVPPRSSAPATAPVTPAAAPATAAQVKPAARPSPTLPTPLRSPATAPAIATHATDAPVKQVSPRAPSALPPVPAPRSVVAAQAKNAQLKQVAPPTPPSTRSSAPARLPAAVSAAQVPDTPIRPVDPVGSSSAPPARARVPSRLATAQPPGALVQQVMSSAPAASPAPSRSPAAVALPARSSATARARVNLKASQATEALVRQVVLQSRTASAPAGLSGAAPEAPAKKTGEAAAPSPAVEAKP